MTQVAVLETVKVENFKSYVSAELRLHDLTLLVGANASGKSNFLEALDLLSWFAAGRQLSDLTHAISGGELGIRGRVQDLFRNPEEPITWRCRWSTGLRLELSLGLENDELSIVAESLFEDDRSVPLYARVDAALPGGHDVNVAYDNFARGGVKPRITCTNQQVVFTQLLTPARFADRHPKSAREIPRACASVKASLQSVMLLDPSPHRMRDYAFEKTERILDRAGSNLSGILSRLVGGGGEEQILTFVQDLPEQRIDGLGFLEGPRGEVMVQLEETFGGRTRKVEAALLSDGTLRVLAIAAALYSVPEGGVVIIEEVDNGVHPSRAAALLSRIEEICRDRDLRALLSTHNPALLDGLPPSSIPHVTFCYREPETGDSQLVVLEDLPDYAALTAQGMLGQLLVRGRLDHYAKSPTTEEEVEARARRVLELIGDEGAA